MSQGVDTFYEVENIEHHIHGLSRWFGISADQSGNDWAADTLNPFVAISGNAVYGTSATDAALVLGTDDTPIISGQVYFDLHQILVVGVTEDTEYKLRIDYGTGTMAAAVAAGQYSEVMVKFDKTNPQQSAGIPVDIWMPRLAIDTKIWIECKNDTDNATISFFVGVHGYTK